MSFPVQNKFFSEIKCLQQRMSVVSPLVLSPVVYLRIEIKAHVTQKTTAIV